MSFAVLAAEAATESSFPTWLPPIFAIVFFALAAIVVFSYRDVANRHREKVSTSHADEHGTEARH